MYVSAQFKNYKTNKTPIDLEKFSISILPIIGFFFFSCECNV